MKNKILKPALMFLSLVAVSCSKDEQTFNNKNESQEEIMLSQKDSEKFVFKEVS